MPLVRSLLIQPRAPSIPLVRGRVWGFMGDSITHGSTTTNYVYGFVQASCAAASAYSSIGLMVEKGVPGNRTDQMLARFTADMTGCNGVVILGGTNDAGALVSVSAYIANMSAMINLARLAGQAVVCVTVPPFGVGHLGAAERALVAGYNSWLLLVAPSMGVIVADAHALLTNPATGDMYATMDSGDGAHPNNLGHRRIAQAVGPAMLQAIGTNPHLLPTNALLPGVAGAAANNLVTNPLMAGSHAGADGMDGVLPTGWARGYDGVHNDPHPVCSMPADASGKLLAGRWMELDYNNTGGGTGTRKIETTLGAGWSVGDRLAVTARLEVQDVAGGWEAACTTPAGGVVSVSLIKQSQAGFVTIGEYSAATGPDWGPIWHTVIVPSGSTTLLLWVSIAIPAGLHVKFRIGEVGVFNLTTLGLTGQL